jgi:2-oxoglutarate dehydrogenase E2 component (dihydrolipoamide succinyltransferase)
MSTNIVVPELGESVVEARVAKWLKKQGDQVAAGDPLVELETEKIDLEVSADRAGVLATIKHQEGADVKVGEILAVLEESTNGASAQPTVPEVAKVPEVPKASVPKAVAASSDKKATPTAKNVAKSLDVKLDSVESKGSRVTKDDVLKAANPRAERNRRRRPPSPQAPSPEGPKPRPASGAKRASG